jgi:hypothetical protein
MERSMKTSKLPRTDSIKELAQFWDTHDLADFEDELEEVPETDFEGGESIRVPLKPAESKAIRRLAKSRGVTQTELAREWVVRGLEQGRSEARR